MLNLLSKTGKLGIKLYSTPMTPNVQITREVDLFEDPERYRRVVRKLNYLTITCPDKCFESVYVISHSQSLGDCRGYPMLFERSSWTWNIVKEAWAYQN